MKAALHVGLALVLVLAPALCCCNARWLATTGAASPAPEEPRVPGAPPSCCHTEATSCCHQPAADAPAAPSPPAPPSCACTAERPDVAPAEGAATVQKPGLSAELLPVPASLDGPFTPASGAARGGHGPPERAGTDARSAALFERHVLRC